MKVDRRFMVQQQPVQGADYLRGMHLSTRVEPADLLPEHTMTTLAFGACGVSLLMAPLDFILSPSYSWLLFAVLAKWVFVLVGLCAINYGRLAYPAFAFCCCLSVFSFACFSFDFADRSRIEIAANAGDAAVKLLFVLVFLKGVLSGRRARRRHLTELRRALST